MDLPPIQEIKETKKERNQEPEERSESHLQIRFDPETDGRAAGTRPAGEHTATRPQPTHALAGWRWLRHCSPAVRERARASRDEEGQAAGEGALELGPCTPARRARAEEVAGRLAGSPRLGQGAQREEREGRGEERREREGVERRGCVGKKRRGGEEEREGWREGGGGHVPAISSHFYSIFFPSFLKFWFSN